MRATKKDVVYDDILGRLISAKYRFGERILVKELAAEIESSRQPILAALNALGTDGFVRIIPQVGCEVVNPSVREIGDFYKMFARNEGLLAELAAERRTSGQLRTLKNINRQIKADLEENEGEDYRELNRQFHATFHLMASSPLLDNRQSSIFAMSDFFITQTVGFTPHMSDAVNEHDLIIAALEAQDPEAARIAAEHHINEVANTVMQAISDN
tara:strand:+ start:24949 stop:25590 length:642 start_codon:yes stop_codon:yes gene_type:complete